MKHTLPALLLTVLIVAVVGALALTPTLAVAQLEATPILGPPAVVTPLMTTEPGSEDGAAQPFPEEPELPGAADVTPTATALVSTRPDSCEPNDTPEQPCDLPLDAVSGPFTFVPEGDRDFFRLDLPQEASIQTIVTVRATQGLDLVLSARQGSALLASGTFSLTLEPTVQGLVLLRVENRDPRLAAGESYRIEVRRSIAPPSTTPAAASSADALENNWSFVTAAPIAVGVVYDLTFVCPETRPNACPGGDHDHLLVPVKAGVAYLIATFDLDPGVDPVIELFWNQTTTSVMGNDDYAPGGMLAALRWTAPSDGLLGVRVAPRNGGLPQQLAKATKAGYRFAIAPEASELATKLAATIRQQANVPTPTATPANAASSAGTGGTTGGGAATVGGGSSPGAQESIAAGPALIVHKTVLRHEPNERATMLATLAPEARVTVRGPVSGLWVSVESEASILPGWVRWSDLRRDTATADGSTASAGGSATATIDTPSTAQASGATAAPAALPTAASASGSTATSSAERVTVAVLDPVLPPPAPLPAARVPFSITVAVVATDRPPTGSNALGFATPTPDRRQPVVGVRVQVVTVFGDLLAEGLTDARGEVQLSRDIRPGDALSLRIPAWGVELPIAPDQTTLIVTVPEEAP